MFYLGMRSSRGYLDALARIRQSETPNDIVTVAGGLAFLHAISPATHSLTIVDCDPDTLAHWSLIRALIAESTSLADFLTLLSGHASVGDGSDAVLGPRVDVRSRLISALSAADLATYDQTYGALDVDVARGVGRVAQSIVGFTGTNLRRQHFNWQFGEGNLASDATFAMLKRQLATMPVRLEQARWFEALDFDAVFPPSAPGRQRVFLASNCESPLFTGADAIFLRVLQTATQPVHYVSWNRDAIVGSGDVTPLTAPLPPRDGRRATLLVTSRFAFARLRRSAHWSRIVSSLDELQATPSYGFHLLVSAGQTEEEIAACLMAVAPAYRNVVWVPRWGGRAAAWPTTSSSYDRSESIVFAGKPAWWFPLRGQCASAP